MVSRVASFLMVAVPLFLLEVFSNTSDVGVFSIVVKLSILVSLILLVVNTITGPRFAELYWSNKHHELQSFMSTSAKIIFIASFVLVFVIAVFADQLLSLFGEEFIAGKYALYILLLGEMINAITGPVGIFMNMTGNQVRLKLVSLLSLLVTVILSFILIPSLGINGAAISLFVGVSMKFIYLAIFVNYKLKFKTFYLPFVLKG